MCRGVCAGRSSSREPTDGKVLPLLHMRPRLRDTVGSCCRGKADGGDAQRDFPGGPPVELGLPDQLLRRRESLHLLRALGCGFGIVDHVPRTVNPALINFHFSSSSGAVVHNLRLFYLQHKNKWRQKESVSWIIYSFVGSMCNAIGALLSKQLTIQVFTGCYMAVVDVINFILTLFPACSFKLKSKSGRSHARKRRSYRSSLFALSLPLSVGAGCYFMTTGALPVSEDYHGPQRRLLGTLLQENTEIMGFSLGIVAVIISWTVRCPLITKVWRGKMFPVMQLWAYFFSVLASVLYAAAVMAHDRQVDYFVRATPWFLIVLGSAALDVAIIFLSCMMKSMLMQQLGLEVNASDVPDAQILLAQEEEETEEEEDDGRKHKGKEKEKSWMPLNVVPHPRSLHKTAEIGHYMELSIEQVQQAELCTMTLPGEGHSSAGETSHKEPPSLPESPVQLVDARFSSTSSSEVSSINSELEWTFEDLNHPLMEGRAEMSSIHPNDSSVLNACSMSDTNTTELAPEFWLHDEDCSLAAQTSTEDGPRSTKQTHSIES